jgi:hypothetical protein
MITLLSGKYFNKKSIKETRLFFYISRYKIIRPDIKIELGILFSVLLITVYSCSDVDTKDLNINNPKIRSALEKRKSEYAAEILENCRRDVLAKAEIYVDSLISAEINFQLSDSIVFPEKPVKPEWPGPIIVPETIMAKPIYERKLK